MYIEKGIDINGSDIWFVLDGADLVESFYSEQEAINFVQNA